MDYGTFFFTFIVSMTVSASCVGLLAWYNRSIAGMRWFAGATALLLVKLALQGLEGRVPWFLSVMAANEVYLVYFVMQLIGMRWFVVRTPFRHRWPFAAIGAVLVVHFFMCLGNMRYTSDVINIPEIGVCAVTAWMLFRQGRRPVSRAAAVILCAEVLVMSYRAWLTDLSYQRPWETINAHSDPRWLYSLAAMALLTSCMLMCYMWFLVTELGRVLAEQARTDSLTGALNRRAIEEAAMRETTRSIRHGHPLCMIVLDIDHFKRLNDSLGHAAGDCALKSLVCEVRAGLRECDLLARTGGEEFSILLPDTSASAAVVAAERVRRAVEEMEVPFDGKTIRITISAGAAQQRDANRFVGCQFGEGFI